MTFTNAAHNRTWEIAKKLVGYDTVSSKTTTPAAEYLAALLDANSFEVRFHTDNIGGVAKTSLVAWAGPALENGLILSGHIDVVPFDDQPGWRYDPLRLTLEDNHIYGRGASDMKVFLAQCVAVGEELNPAKLTKPLMFIFTCDEELSCMGAKRLCNILPSLTGGMPLPKQAWIGEPTGFDVCSAHKGCVMFSIKLAAQGGHSSLPLDELDAISAMGHVIRALNEFDKKLRAKTDPQSQILFPEFPHASINLGRVTGGAAANMIAEECTLLISIRTLTGQDPRTLLADLQQQVEAALQTATDGVHSEVSIAYDEPVICPPLNSPETGTLPNLLLKLTGNNQTKGVPYATDGGHFQDLGIASYLCGPGLLYQAHKPNESMPIENFLKGCDLVKNLVNAYCMKPL